MAFTDADTAGVCEQSGTCAVDHGYLLTRRPERLGNSAYVQAAVFVEF